MPKPPPYPDAKSSKLQTRAVAAQKLTPILKQARPNYVRAAFFLDPNLV